MTRNEFLDLFAYLRSAYQDHAVTEAEMAVYWREFETEPADMMFAAARTHARTSPYWPKIADLLKPSSESGLPEPPAILAEIRQAIQDHGWPNPPGRTWHLSPIAAAVVDTMGWDNLCQSENPEAFDAHIVQYASVYRRRAQENRNYFAVGAKPPVPCLPLTNHQGPQSISEILGIAKSQE